MLLVSRKGARPLPPHKKKREAHLRNSLRVSIGFAHQQRRLPERMTASRL